ncbi:EF-hand domain-containing protein [Akkermansiaceae bacterium]|nr:EF-hand domain-containing protein [Akkermansiaceae bacterium]
MKLKYIFIAGALLGDMSLAQESGKSFGDGTLPDFLQNYDVNQDGVIDEEERQAIKQLRKEARAEQRSAIDADSDGKVSLEERKAAQEAIREKISSKRAIKFSEIAGDDGLLSYEEFVAMPTLSRISKGRVTSIFARLDRDNSGQVTLEEFNDRLRGHGQGNGNGNGNGNGT